MIRVKVIPRSSKNAILVQGPNCYKIKLTSPPVENAANKQLIELLAETLSVAPNRIEILSGMHSRTKRLKIHGITGTQLAKILSSAGPADTR